MGKNKNRGKRQRLGIVVTSDDSNRAIFAQPNARDTKNHGSYIAKLYKKDDDRWYAASHKNTQGMITFIDTKPTLGQVIDLHSISLDGKSARGLVM